MFCLDSMNSRRGKKAFLSLSYSEKASAFVCTVLLQGLIKNDMSQNCPLVMADYHTDIVRVGLVSNKRLL